jgi:serine/threonine-protein kinase
MLWVIVLERYTIIERMAVGGMGEVFLARQRGVGGFARTVVIKKLLPDVEGSDDAARRLLDEARIVAALSHENVVSIIEVGTEDDLPVMVLEYVHGENAGTLRNRAGKRDLPIAIAVCARIVCDAARGLHHAHEAIDVEGRRLNVVHRDVAPKNLFVRTDGMTKVGDFGIAAAEQRLARTATGAVTGTLSYMSPEQISSRQVGPASDQWSLGVVLWELLTGYRLFKAQGPAEVVDGILNAKLRSPRRLREDVPRALSDITKTMLQREVGRRFASMDAVANAIEAAVPECVGVAGRAAVAAFVEDMSGHDLRERLKRIEEGAEVTSFNTRSGSQRQSPSQPETAASRAAPGTRGLTAETGQATGRGGGSGLTVTIADISGVAAPIPSAQRSWRAAIVGGVVAVVAVVAVGAAVTLSRRPPDPATLTLAFLHDSRAGRSMVLREELLQDAVESGVDEARMDAVAVVLASLCDQRLDSLIGHFSLPDEARRTALASQTQLEQTLEDRARAALQSIGGTHASAALDMWAEECWAPIRWLEPSPAHEVQANIRTRIEPLMRDTATWREAVVRRLLKRGGADVDVVMGTLWPIVNERQALIARYGTVAAEDMPAIREQILAREQAGRTMLQASVGTAGAATLGNAVNQIAFIDFDDVGAWVPLFAYLPSVKAKEPGAR